MARFNVACVAAGVLLLACAGNAQAWRLFPSFSTGYWNETNAPACPCFNSSTELDSFRPPPSVEHGSDGPDHSHPHPPHPPGPHPPHRRPGPPFYHGASGPRFHVVNRTCGYETRSYNESTWVITNSTGWTWEFAVHNGFTKLDPYFHGENANDTHFRGPPSVPVVSHFIPRKNFSDTGKQFLVARYVPNKCHKKNSTWTAPEPNNEHIKLKTSPAHYTTYVRTFPGLGLHWAVLGEMRALRHDLKRDGIDVKEGRFFAAQYDPPTALFHRHNEVWFIPTPENKTEADSMGLDTMWNEGGWALEADLDETS
ncbi:hypothetical protein WJX73_010426 [Symbiochloris irregularis]|uniref:Uncharacterized protein n=1 Tax=Symbiochloris irregularis TaxID=706552 RepID=A0AAW1PV08_9CHLO